MPAVPAWAQPLSAVLTVSSAVTDPDIAAVQTLVDELPTVDELKAMAQDDRRAAYDRVIEAYDAYEELDAGQREQVVGAETFDKLFAAFNGMAAPLEDASGIQYVDENGEQRTAGSATVVDGSTTSWGEGWYVVSTDITISSRITVTGNVNLILADGATLTASAGITVAQGDSLTIYGQQNGAGALSAGGTSTPDGAAGIGGFWDRKGSRTISCTYYTA